MHIFSWLIKSFTVALSRIIAFSIITIIVIRSLDMYKDMTVVFSIEFHVFCHERGSNDKMDMFLILFFTRRIVFEIIG